MATIVIGADPEWRAALARALRPEGHTLVEAESSGDLAGGEVDLVIAPAEGLAQAGRDAARILLTDLPAVEAAHRAEALRADDWLGSADAARVVFVTRRVLAAHALAREVARLRELTAVDLVAGSSPLAAELRRAIQRAAASDGLVLLSGPAGAAPDRIARAIHAGAARRGGPFVSLACGALPAAIAEAELGTRIALAAGGTLFLEEVGALTLAAQAQVLHALDGGLHVIASTSRDLAALVAQDRFRPELAARLGERTIVVPPLRARLEDLPPLVERHLATHRRGTGGETPAVSEDALARLAAHDWPGDVRELETVLERAIALARGPVLTAADLPFGERPADETELPAERSFFKTSVAAFERDLIMTALRDAGGNRSRAAELLGIYRRLLYAKIKEYGLEGYPRKGR